MKIVTHNIKKTKNDVKPLGLARNAMWNVLLGLVWPTLIMVITTKIYLQKLGPRMYGVFAIINSILALAGLLRLGVGEATVKYVAQYRALYAHKKLSGVIGATFFVYCIVGIIGGIGIGITAPWTTKRLLHLVGMEQEIAMLSLQIAAIGFTATQLIAGSSSVFAGFERYDRASLINASSITFAGIAGVCTLLCGGTLANLVTAIVVSLWGIAIIAITMIWKTCKISAFTISSSKLELRKVFAFSMFSSINNLATTAFYTGDRMIVGLILGPEAVSFYSIGVSVSSKIYTSAIALTQILLPRFSANRETKNGLKKERTLFWSSVTLVATFSSICVSILLAIGTLVFELWLGDSFSIKTILVLKVSAISFGVLAVNLIGFYYLNAIGKPKKATGWYATASALSLGCMWGFGKVWGMPGILAGTLVFPTILLGSFAAAARQVGSEVNSSKKLTLIILSLIIIGVTASSAGWYAGTTIRIASSSVLLGIAEGFLIVVEIWIVAGIIAIHNYPKAPILEQFYRKLKFISPPTHTT